MSSKVLSVATVIEKNRVSSDTPFLAALDVDVIDPTTGDLVEVLHLVNNTESITFNGSTYAPAAFDIELKAEAGTQQSVSLSIKDYSRAVQARMQQYGGGVGFAVTVMILNAGALDQPAEVVEYFEVTDASAANYECSFTLGAENSLNKRFPRRRQMRDFCQWRYRGPQCGYVGNQATKSGGGSSWNAHLYTVKGYTGGAYASARAVTTTHDLMFGLNSDPLTDQGYTSLDYALYLTPGGGLVIYESGSVAASGFTYAVGDVLEVLYDGARVLYLNNGTILRTVTVSIATALYFDSSFYGVSGSLRDIRFTREAVDYSTAEFTAGANMTYTPGLSSCDLSLAGANGCNTHSNTIRFGAFPGITSRDVYYG